MNAIDEAKKHYRLWNTQKKINIDAAMRTLEILTQEIEKRDKVINASKKAFSHGIPDSYRGDDDDVGECAFCHGWNQQHEEYCKANALVEALSQLEDK